MTNDKGLEPLINRIYATIDYQESWQEVLEEITHAIGAMGAIITLRDAKTARIVITPQIETELQSPLVACFSQSEINDYLENFRDTDPWAKIQSQVHPYIPTIMSDILPMAEFAKTDLARWLAERRVNDTLIVEIDKSPNHWTAFNLYFWNDGPEQKSEVLAYGKTILEHLQRAWTAGRQQVRAEVLENHLIAGVKADQRAVFLLNPQGQVVAKSQTALTQMVSGLGRIDPKTKRLSFVRNLDVSAEAARLTDVRPNDLAMAEFFQVVPISGNIAELSSGELMGFNVLELRKKSQKHHIPWEDPTLAPRERSAVIWAAQGKNITEFGPSLGLSDRYGRTIWKKAQAKIGNLSQGDLKTLWSENQKSIKEDPKV